MSEEKKPAHPFPRKRAEKSADSPSREDGQEQKGPCLNEPKKEKQNHSVFTYIAILFAVAFFLLLLSYFMQQRNTAQMIEGLRSSATAMENIDMLQRRNMELDQETDTLKEQLNEAKQQVNALTGQVADKEKEAETARQQAAALGQFWQLVQSYENGRYQACRKTIAQMEEAGLVPFLPETEGANAAALFAKIQKAVQK